MLRIVYIYIADSAKDMLRYVKFWLITLGESFCDNLNAADALLKENSKKKITSLSNFNAYKHIVTFLPFKNVCKYEINNCKPK